ncbi:MAG TPA: LysE family transporter [Candidatus Kapabacteria bacterium]|nr:LysE family transporter [Candidatus Kapabacteria bacterium]HPO63335.1 LysE family transporter [Candidatus Kapabacteria bacterium]
MDIIYFLKGLLLGFSVAAPVGPIGILCINRTINNDFKSGFVSGLGAASADFIYGLIAALSLRIISTFLVDSQLYFQAIGFVFLLYLGIKTILKKKSRIELEDNNNFSLLKDYFSTLFLTITNPVTILFFLSVFSGLGLSYSNNKISSSVLLVIGVFTGSAVWWSVLCGITNKIRKRISNNYLKKIDIASGAILIFFAILIIFNLINEFK